jgi:5-methylcytosine-specific restriction endonuclease McrA
MRRANFRCERQKPGEPRHEGPLDVHHKHYDTLGHEGPDDVEVLCRTCHHNEHIPRNKKYRILEAYGQQRLPGLDRWGLDAMNPPLKAA